MKPHALSGNKIIISMSFFKLKAKFGVCATTLDPVKIFNACVFFKAAYFEHDMSMLRSSFMVKGQISITSEPKEIET